MQISFSIANKMLFKMHFWNNISIANNDWPALSKFVCLTKINMYSLLNLFKIIIPMLHHSQSSNLINIMNCFLCKSCLVLNNECFIDELMLLKLFNLPLFNTQQTHHQNNNQYQNGNFINLNVFFDVVKLFLINIWFCIYFILRLCVDNLLVYSVELILVFFHCGLMFNF